MLELFLEKESFINKLPFLDFIRLNKITIKNLSDIREYYRQRNIYIKENSLIGRILETFYINVNKNNEQYYNEATNKSIYCANYFNITSSYNYGDIHKSEFYKDSNEVIILDNTAINFNIEKTWQNVSPLKILTNNTTNIYAGLPNSSFLSKGDGIVFLKLHIPLMLLQYKMFILSQKQKDISATRSTYISRYLLPNAIFSQYDSILFNIIFNNRFNITNDNYINNYPISLRNTERYLNKSVLKLNNYFERSKFNFKEILHLLPSCYYDNFFKFNILPDITETRQVSWALFLSKLKLIEYLISFKDNSPENNKYINNIKLETKKFKRSLVMNTILDESIVKSIETRLEKILEI